MSNSNLYPPIPEEIVASTEEASFGEVLSRFEEEQSASTHSGGSPGEAVQGTVIAVTPDAVFVDIGRKMEGVLSIDKVRDSKGEVTIKAGDSVLVNITGRDSEGNYQLSTVHVERPKDWSHLELAFAEKKVIAGTVVEMVKGGLRVDVGVRAFMPASRSGARDAAEMEKLVGQEIRCRITKLDTTSEDVVVDRRAILEEEAAQAKEKAFSDVAEGAVVQGTVRSLTDFGAFVDIGGVDGLLHVADMSWHRVNKPADILSVGDSVEVKVLKVNPENRRISLGLKQLQPDPWSVALSQFHVGDRVRGTVARLTDFGAFVELAPGVDGLIHVSEMSWTKKIRKPADVLKKGESVDVMINGINPAEKRISLSLKQALGDPWDEAQKKFAVGSVVEGTISNLANFGAFVDLGDGIEGMVHIGDISREKRLNHPKEALNTGQLVKAQVLEFDRERRRIRLGMKQLEPTSVDHYIAEHQAGETVTGRVVDVSTGRVKIELGDGVFAWCRLAHEAPKQSAAAEAARQSQADLSSMTAMLNAKWKQGRDMKGDSDSGEAFRPGQIRSFRITSLDAAQKRIELEVAN